MAGKAIAFLLLALGLLAAGSPPVLAAEVGTAHLVVSDPSGRMPKERLAQRAERIEALFARILDLWQADPREAQQGKIRVVLLPPGRELRLSVFRWVREGNGKVREVLAAPPGEEPQMLAHKLTSALFPSKDKLIRNMMGEVTEMRLGNPRSFPHCGLDVDAWVLALLRLGLLLPLSELGPGHDTWGMGAQADGIPFTRDPDRHHRAYAEAASFGAFLFDRYGMDKLKQLHQRTGDQGRPWEAVFGSGLAGLEAEWLEHLQQKETQLAPEVALAADLYAADPAAACDQALQARP